MAALQAMAAWLSCQSTGGVGVAQVSEAAGAFTDGNGTGAAGAGGRRVLHINLFCELSLR